MLQLSIHYSQFTMNYLLPFTIDSSSYVCEMLSGKLLVNDKCKLINISEGAQQ